MSYSYCSICGQILCVCKNSDNGIYQLPSQKGSKDDSLFLHPELGSTWMSDEQIREYYMSLSKEKLVDIIIDNDVNSHIEY